MKKQTIDFENTEVATEKTASEIEDMLRKAGVTKTAKAYENNKVTSISFQMATPEGTLPFTLPVNVPAVYQILYNKRRALRGWPDNDQQERIQAQAERVAWRTVHWWLKGQLALLNLQMVTVTEIFMGYLLVAPNETLYERLMSGGLHQLTDGVVNG